jgi:hypothetical protein
MLSFVVAKGIKVSRCAKQGEYARRRLVLVLLYPQTLKSQSLAIEDRDGRRCEDIDETLNAH